MPRTLLLFFLLFGCSDETSEMGLKVSSQEFDTGESALSECEDFRGRLNLSWPVVGSDSLDWVVVELRGCGSWGRHGRLCRWSE